MDTQKQSIIDRLKQANNILVTVSKNPSVDQLAAAIGFTLALNKLGKHAIAVFSGQVPSTLEFLKPEETFEKTTDSLRDFIISLDKAKADKLRYKVEDEMVKIFITPYRTSLSDKDLEFSQGDFNVEVVVALGVKNQQDLDDAITSQGRILHDATVIDINTDAPAQVGTLSWAHPGASSLCEMVLQLVQPMKEKLLDGQMATALLTGIVAETERFSNEKTSPETMQASSKLMAAGANQQLVAAQLQAPEPEPEPEPTPEPEVAEPEVELPEAQPEPTPEPEPEPEAPAPPADGALEIAHGDEEQVDPDAPVAEENPEEEEEKEEEVSQIVIDEHGQIVTPGEEPAIPPSQVSTRGLTLQPPTLGGQLTANTETEKLDPSTDILGDGALPSEAPMLSHDTPPATKVEVPDVAPNFEAPQTLASLEEAVHSPHVQQAQGGIVTPDVPPLPVTDPSTATPSVMPLPTQPAAGPEVIEPASPPPVPPPMMPPNFAPPGSDNTTAL